MGLRFLEHFLILTHDPDGTRDWWCRALGLREGPHPEFGFPVHWLYIGDQDVVHIGTANHSRHQNAYLEAPDAETGERRSSTAAAAGLGTGRLDHVCFNCEGIEEFVDRLKASGIEFNERQAHNQALYQLFFWEPINGIKIELNFSAEEARRAGRLPARTATDAAQQ